MKKSLFTALLVSMVAVPTVVAQGGTADEGKRLNVRGSVTHDVLPADECRYILSRGGDSCRVTSVVRSWDTGEREVMRPFVGETANRRCTRRRPCKVHVALERRYRYAHCVNYSNACRRHHGPVYWKVQQKGEYWRARTCEYSLYIPTPHNCDAWAAWTHDNDWRRIGFHSRRHGWHTCQRGDSSGVTIEVDRCWTSDHRDPADVRSRYTRDVWRADKGWVGMRWTRHYWPNQHRTELSSLKLGVRGNVRKRSSF